MLIDFCILKCAPPLGSRSCFAVCVHCQHTQMADCVDLLLCPRDFVLGDPFLLLQVFSYLKEEELCLSSAVCHLWCVVVEMPSPPSTKKKKNKTNVAATT